VVEKSGQKNENRTACISIGTLAKTAEIHHQYPVVLVLRPVSHRYLKFSAQMTDMILQIQILHEQRNELTEPLQIM
jgi:hypothetical protein